MSAASKQLLFVDEISYKLLATSEHVDHASTAWLDRVQKSHKRMIRHLCGTDRHESGQPTNGRLVELDHVYEWLDRAARQGGEAEERMRRVQGLAHGIRGAKIDEDVKLDVQSVFKLVFRTERGEEADGLRRFFNQCAYAYAKKHPS